MSNPELMHPTDELKKEHVSVLELLREITALTATEQLSSATEWVDSFDRACIFLQTDVARHFEKEEKALFPVLAKYVGNQTGPVAVMLQEHEQHQALLSQLCAAVQSRDWGSVRSAWNPFAQLLGLHIMKEDSVLFPMAERLMNAEERTEVHNKMEAINRSIEIPMS
ncbi:MAG: hemerythrin domain-containing protein [Acidobacteriia bacterium]|nr:hemerythrin domain-containing protein [Terriglobia bacterium]